MVNLYRCCLCCFLYFVSGLVFSDVLNFPNSNTIPTTSGNTARLVGVTSVNSSGKTANVVIDARDRFGNSIRVFKTANFSPSKLKSYVTTCVRNPTACLASAALSSALIYYGYTLTSDGRIILPGNAGSYSECLEKPVEDIHGGVSTAFGSIPCAIGPNWAGKYVLYTFQPNPQDPNAPMNGDLPQGVVRLNGMTYVDGGLAENNIYYQNWYDIEPQQDASEQPVSDNDVASMALQNPANLQVSPGVYADVFDPVDIPEVKTDSDFDPNPSPDTNTEPEPEYEEMIGMEQVPEQVVDISSYFDWGSGWLPKQCPPAQVESFMGDQFSFKYDFICSHISDYLAPAMRVFAIFLFLGILMGGVRD